MIRSSSVVVTLICILVCAGTARAQFIDWDGGGFNNSWQNSANWNAAPPRIPLGTDIARIGTLAAADDERVTLSANAVAAALLLSSGADVDTNGHSLGIGSLISVDDDNATPSELLVRPASAPGALAYSVSGNVVTIGDNARLTMLGGRLEVRGTGAADGVLNVEQGAALIGYGEIVLLEDDFTVNIPYPFTNHGSITVGDPESVVLGEPPARTLEIATPNAQSDYRIFLGVSGSPAEVLVNRNSTLRIDGIDGMITSAQDMVLRANATFDSGAVEILHGGDDQLIIDSGAVDIGLAVLPALPAVIQGTDQFRMNGGELLLDQSDEALHFNVFFRGDGGFTSNQGTIRFNAGALITTAASFVAAGSGTLVNGQGSDLDIEHGANIDSPLTNEGTMTIAADSEGEATVDGLILTDSSTLAIDARSVIPGQYDTVTVEGNAVLDGTLIVSLDPAFVPLPGNEFTILSTTFGVVSGVFETEVLPVIDGLTFDVLYPNSQTVVLQVVEALPGDYNHDGSVDAADYVVWRRGLGTIFNHDHYDLWRANFGNTLGMGSGGSGEIITAVPEQSSIMLLNLAAVFSMLCRAARSAFRWPAPA